MLDHRIETFLTLFETMNYRETAEILHITQPAVTQHIQFLEKQYACKLFSYKNRHLAPTHKAVILAEYARAMRTNEADIRQKLMADGIQELKIGATKTIGDYVISDQVHQYLQDKDHSLTLIVDNTEHLLRLLEKNQLDFAIVEGFFDRNKLESHLLRRESFVGICPKGHPFSGREITMDELLQQTIIYREEGSGTRAILEQELFSHNESLSRFKRHICISSFKVILDLVKQGFGVSFVYNILADSCPDVDKFTLQGEPIVREFNLVYLRHTHAKEKINLFFCKKIPDDP